MIKNVITAAAFEAIKATLPLGSVGYEAEPNQRGERYVWLEARRGTPSSQNRV